MKQEKEVNGRIDGDDENGGDRCCFGNYLVELFLFTTSYWIFLFGFFAQFISVEMNLGSLETLASTKPFLNFCCFAS